MPKMNPKEISKDPELVNLFPIKDEILKKIEEDMLTRGYGFDPSQPVILGTWNGAEEPVCIDGHTRLQAAINAGFDQVPVFTHEFDTKQEAMAHAIHLQCSRRNLTNSDQFRLMRVVDNRGERQKDPDTGQFTKAQGCAKGKSAEITAKILGVSARKVEQMRTIDDYGDPDIIEGLETDEMSINQAYTMTQEKKKAEAPATVVSTKPKQKDDSEKGSKTSTVQTENSTPKQKEAPERKQPDKPQAEPRTVSLSDDHFAALAELGNCSIEEHVASAIEQYLARMREEDEKQAADEEVEFDDGEYDD